MNPCIICHLCISDGLLTFKLFPSSDLCLVKICRTFLQVYPQFNGGVFIFFLCSPPPPPLTPTPISPLGVQCCSHGECLSTSGRGRIRLKMEWLKVIPPLTPPPLFASAWDWDGTSFGGGFRGFRELFSWKKKTPKRKKIKAISSPG